MKKECERTRRALPNYLSGHLFKISRIRIERHLEHCVVCRSEFEALRHTEETRQILKDINAPESVVGRVKEGVSSIRKIKKILYRPLWMAGLVLIVAAIGYYFITPRQLDLEIDRIVKTGPSVSAPLPSASSNLTPTTPGQARSLPLHAAAATPAPARLVVTVTTDDDEAAIRRINEIMGEHGQLQKLKFSGSVREIGGSMAAGDLVIFFSRIRSVAKVSYSRKRLESFPAAEPVPFLMKLVYAPGRRHEPGPPVQPVQKSAEGPAGGAVPAAPVQAPLHKPVEVHSEAGVPSAPETAPSQTALP